MQHREPLRYIKQATASQSYYLQVLRSSAGHETRTTPVSRAGVSKGNIMDKTWVLVANAERARCFQRDSTSHALTELSDFVHPHASLAGEAQGGALTGAAGKGHGRTGHAGTQFEPHTPAQAKERDSFARQLADYLNEGVAAKRCNGLVLIASSPMLGELRPCLSPATQKVVQSAVVGDLTRYEGPELKKRVDDALRLPD